MGERLRRCRVLTDSTRLIAGAVWKSASGGQLQTEAIALLRRTMAVSLDWMHSLHEFRTGGRALRRKSRRGVFSTSLRISTLDWGRPDD